MDILYRINLLDVTYDGAACQFLDEQGCTTQCIWDVVDIDAALVAERGIGRKLLTTCRLAYPCRVEAGTLEEHIGGLLGRAGFKSAENSSDTHRFFSIANHEIAVGKLVLLAIESDERSSVGTGSYNNLSSLDLVGIESVHWHSSLKENIVGDINDVVDGAQTDGLESVLEPFGRLLDSHSCDG